MSEDDQAGAGGAAEVTESPCVEEIVQQNHAGQMNEQNAVVQPLLTGKDTAATSRQRLVFSVIANSNNVFPFFRLVPVDHGVCLLEGRQDQRHLSLRPVLQEEPLQRRVHHLRRIVRVLEVLGEL